MDQPAQTRHFALEELLPREPVQLDQEKIRECVQDQVILVTGAAGSIGAELCRQIARFRPSALVAFDVAETPLFYLERELKAAFPELALFAELGSVTQPETLCRVMRTHKPAIVYHAAAYKHVPVLENQIYAAIENNIFGTWNVAEAAIQSGVSGFVLISSDKAVAPSSVMGATKRAAELIVRALHCESGTSFSAVRFGNVLGSAGSVVPIFEQQIAAGGPVTLTDPEMYRYFMTAPEAAQLVLQAFAMGAGGEIFTLDMGEPVRILDLAQTMIRLNGREPGKDILIECTGVRPGEKLMEQLNRQDERMVPTSHEMIRSFAATSTFSVRQIRSILDELQIALSRENARHAMTMLKKLVPDYIQEQKGSHALPFQLDDVHPKSAESTVWMEI
jgi:FlaA1/EpsC-like NDP-sugar epimerase